MRDFDNKIEQIKAIKNGKGVQYILDEAYRILGNPALTYDLEYKVIAYTENIVTDDPIWNESETAGMVDHNRLLFCRDECFSERAAEAKQIIFLRSNKLKYDRIFGKIFTKNNMQVGYACMVACHKPLEDDDPELFKTVCDILNKELCSSAFYQNYGQVYLETLVDQLIGGNIENTELISHIESIYMGLKGILRLAVVDISQSDPTYSKLAYFRDIFKQTRPDFKYAVYSNYIVGLFSSDHTALEIEPIVKLYNLFEQNNLYAGISNCFEKIYELPIYYNQAVNALIHGLKRNSNQRIFLHDET